MVRGPLAGSGKSCKRKAVFGGYSSGLEGLGSAPGSH